MKRITLLNFTLAVSSIIAAVHIFAIVHYLYWEYRWLDMPQHFMGGFLIGLMAAGFSFGIWRGTTGWKYKLLGVVIPVIIIGIFWEYFEIFAGVPIYGDYIWDTAHDLLMDTLGGIAAAVVIRYFVR